MRLILLLSPSKAAPCLVLASCIGLLCACGSKASRPSLEQSIKSMISLLEQQRYREFIEQYDYSFNSVKNRWSADRLASYMDEFVPWYEKGMLLHDLKNINVSRTRYVEGEDVIIAEVPIDRSDGLFLAFYLESRASGWKLLVAPM